MESDLDDTVPESHGIPVDVAGEDEPSLLPFGQVTERTTKSGQIEHGRVLTEVVVDARFDDSFGSATEESENLQEISIGLSHLTVDTLGLCGGKKNSLFAYHIML